MANFLRIYQMQNYDGWIKASELAAMIAGKNKTLARRLREWTHTLIRNPESLPAQEYRKWSTSILRNEDIAQEIHLHLQSHGKYVSAMDIVRFLDTLEMRDRLGLKKTISEQTAQQWMGNMGYRWKRDPKGQYKDGHEREDVVVYWQNVFLPFFATIAPFTRQWNFNGKLSNTEHRLLGRRIVVWVHDESTFYAHDRHTLRWVHESESAKPYAKGEGALLMVADLITVGCIHQTGELPVLTYNLFVADITFAEREALGSFSKLVKIETDISQIQI
jgi:hypothetical protein